MKRLRHFIRFPSWDQLEKVTLCCRPQVHFHQQLFDTRLHKFLRTVSCYLLLLLYNWQIINDNASYSLANCETVLKSQLESLTLLVLRLICCSQRLLNH